ncbi:MAG: hypothetical protein RIR70_2257 [Pseudomonadota bacterium]|jgi:hypothetical protein
MSEELLGPGGDLLVSTASRTSRELLHHLQWLLTSPLPVDEYVVAVSLSEACEAALDILGSRSVWCSPASAEGAESS